MKNKGIKTIDDLRKSYNKIYSKSKFQVSDYYYTFSLSFIPKDEQRNKKLLDIGCGSGNLLKLAHEKGLLTHGIDISDLAVKQANEEVPNAELVVGTADNLAWKDGYFDYVTCICSIEHHIQPDKSVAEISRVLSYEGKAFIMLPNSFFIHDILRVWITGEGPDHGQDLERLATAKEWQCLLEDNGLIVDKVVKYNQKKGFFINLVRPFVPFNLSKHFMYICSKK